MNFYKNSEHYFLVIISSKHIKIIKLDEDEILFDFDLDRNKELNFTYIEPTFNKEIIVGFSNGDVEIIDPFAEDEKIAETKEQIHNKCSKFYDIKSLVKDKTINEPRHEESVVQIKMSDYYPFYVSIADEMIIYQLKE